VSRRLKRLDNAAGFILLCVAGGIGLFSWVNGETVEVGTKNTVVQSNYTDAASVEASANAAADKLEAEADAIDRANAKEPSKPAVQHSDTVFIGGSKGTLSCAFDGFAAFQVDWQTNDQDGLVAVNGHPTKGTVIGDWEPASNRVRYDIEVGGPKDGNQYHIEIADDGTLTGDGGKSGACKPAA
jgi:hypothetical protein